jgi:hypothetical protein
VVQEIHSPAFSRHAAKTFPCGSRSAPPTREPNRVYTERTEISVVAMWGAGKRATLNKSAGVLEKRRGQLQVFMDGALALPEIAAASILRSW